MVWLEIHLERIVRSAVRVTEVKRILSYRITEKDVVLHVLKADTLAT